MKLHVVTSAIWLLLLAGCSSKEEPNAVVNSWDELRVANSHITVSDASEPIVRAASGESLPVSGEFRLTDPSMEPFPVRVRIMLNRPGKKPLIANERFISVVKEGDIVRFTGEIKAPPRKGSYEIEISQGAHTFSSHRLNVVTTQ